MGLKIRLRKQGRTNRPFYRLVVTEKREKRDGKYVEELGWYNPVETNEEKILLLESDRIQHWLDNGAEMSEKAEALIAKGAPDVLRAYKDRITAKRLKMVAQRRARNKAAASA